MRESMDAFYINHQGIGGNRNIVVVVFCQIHAIKKMIILYKLCREAAADIFLDFQCHFLTIHLLPFRSDSPYMYNMHEKEGGRPMKT